MICVSLAESTSEALLKCLGQVAVKADLAEVRLDCLKDVDRLDFIDLLKDRPCPLIFTNRSRDEGGRFSGSEQDRIGLLKQAVSAGADYVDIELRTDPAYREDVVQRAREAGTKLIISFHDFLNTPPKERLVEVLDLQRQAGADISKIVTMAEGPRDVLNIFSLYFKALDGDFPLIAFCMGTFGKMSRLVCPSLGAYLTYCSSAEGHEAAPGQITLDDMTALVDYLSS